jgi:hypothetical protein
MSSSSLASRAQRVDRDLPIDLCDRVIRIADGRITNDLAGGALAEMALAH